MNAHSVPRVVSRIFRIDRYGYRSTLEGGPWRRLGAVGSVVLPLVALALVATTSATALATSGGACDPSALPAVCAVHPVVPPQGVSFGWRGMDELGRIAGRLTYGNEKPAIWTEESGVIVLPMPPGMIAGEANGLSADDWIATTLIRFGIGERAVILFPDGTNHEILAIGENGQTYARAMRMDGTVVGRQAIGSPEEINFPHCGFRWSLAEGKTDVIVGPGPNCEVLDINEQGVMVGWTGVAKNWPVSNGFIVDGEKVTLLPPIPGGFSSTATAINDLGWVVGEGRIPGNDPWGFGVTRGFLWRDGEMIRFDPSPGYEICVASGVTNTGLVTIYSWGAIEPGMPSDTGALWCDGERLELTEPWVPPPYISFTPRGINNAGQMGGGATYPVEYPQWGTFARADLFMGAFEDPTPDLTADGVVDGADLQALLGLWGTASPQGDLDMSGLVDGADLGVLLAHWGPVKRR